MARDREQSGGMRGYDEVVAAGLEPREMLRRISSKAARADTAAEPAWMTAEQVGYG